MVKSRLTYSDVLKLKKFTTPTVYNGWEQITAADRTAQTNREPLTDFMPAAGPMVGFAVTLVIEPSNPHHPQRAPGAVREYREYVAALPGPKIVVVQDLDKPAVIASHWGEVNAHIHKALGCVGTITDGAIRDVTEMAACGFKALAGRLAVGHAYGHPVRWGGEVEVFGCRIRPGQLIHADQHGFLAVPEEDEQALLEAAQFMDHNECDTILAAGADIYSKGRRELLDGMAEAGAAFGERSMAKFNQKGEW